MEEVEDKEKYISLQEATEYCEYSQEYLSLRARQGKLKARKIGRNWTTTKEWLHDYLVRVEEYSNGNIAKLKSEIKSETENRIIEIEKKLEKPASEAIVSVSPLAPGAPEDLPIGEFKIEKPVSIFSRIFRTIDNALQDISAEGNYILKNAIYFNKNFRLEIACFIVLFFSVLGIVQGKTTFFELFSKIYSGSNLAEDSAAFVYKDAFSSVSKNVSDLAVGVNSEVSKDDFYCGVANDSVNTFKEYQSWLLGRADAAKNYFAKSPVAIAINFGFETAKDKYFVFDNFVADNIGLASDRYSFAYYSSAKFLAKISTPVVNTAGSFGGLALENTELAPGSVKSVFLGVVSSVGYSMEKFFVFLSNPFGIYDKFAQNTEVQNSQSSQPGKIQQSPGGNGENEGMVVVPSTDKNAEVENKIKNSFSDEVVVKMKDDSTGIITPIFKDHKGSDYLYIMVPAPSPASAK